MFPKKRSGESPRKESNMQPETERKNCLVVIGSLTQTMKAQSALSNAAIFSRVEKADSSTARRGCAYALSYPCSQEANVRAVLRGAGISTRGGF